MPELIQIRPASEHPLPPRRASKRHAISPARLVSSSTDESFPDYYPTPASATRTFLEAIQKGYPNIIRGLVWEPACGQLHMTKEIAAQPNVTTVISSDTHSRPPVDGALSPKTFPPYKDDFLNPTHANSKAVIASGKLNAVITNPPFKLCKEFVEHALSLPLPGGVVMFTRLNFIASKRRTDPSNPEALLTKHPPNAVYVYAGRLSLWSALSSPPPGSNSGTIDYCVSVWDSSNRQPPHQDGGQTLLKFLHVPHGKSGIIEDDDANDDPSAA